MGVLSISLLQTVICVGYNQAMRPFPLHGATGEKNWPISRGSFLCLMYSNYWMKTGTCLTTHIGSLVDNVAEKRKSLWLSHLSIGLRGSPISGQKLSSWRILTPGATPLLILPNMKRRTRSPRCSITNGAGAPLLARWFRSF